MIATRKSAVATALLALASHASAQVASACVTDDVCFKLNIPEKTSSSGDGDIFFQLSGPSDYEWVALGQGNSMSGSNMFVIYTSADGKNVTLSPRLGQGQREPKFNSDAQVTLLEGSGVSGGKMVANVRCENCNSWSGGDADFTADSGQWIYAFQPGGAKNTDDKDASISQHGGHDGFDWDYANAKGGDSVNPLVNAAPSGTAGGGATATTCRQRAAATGSGTASASGTGAGATASPTQTADDDDATTSAGRPTGPPTGPPTGAPTGRPWGPPSKRQEELPYCDEDGGNGGNDSNNSFTRTGMSAAMSKQRKMLIAHGVMACLAFVILFPAGAIAIRLASFPGVVWFHAAFQVFAYLVYIVAFGLGIHIASEMELFDEGHPIIGIVVFILLFFQPIFGFLHHALYKKYQTRTFWSYGHVWVGRIAVTLGIINGGLGFKLADKMRMGSKTGSIVYAVVAVIVWLAWVAASVIGERRRKRNAHPTAPPKYTDSPQVETAQRDLPTRDIPTPPNGHYAPIDNRAHAM